MLWAPTLFQRAFEFAPNFIKEYVCDRCGEPMRRFDTDSLYSRFDEDELVPQKDVKTICGNFILDFRIQDETGYRVGIECDGKEFHEESRAFLVLATNLCVSIATSPSQKEL